MVGDLLRSRVHSYSATVVATLNWRKQIGGCTLYAPDGTMFARIGQKTKDGWWLEEWNLHMNGEYTTHLSEDEARAIAETTYLLIYGDS